MQTQACYSGWWQTQRQTQKTNTKTNTENEPQHILTHEELKAIEENPRDVAQNEDTHNADEDERQVHLDNSKYDINKNNSKRQINYIRMLFRPPSLRNSSNECERTWKKLFVRKYLHLFVFVFISICWLCCHDLIPRNILRLSTMREMTGMTQVPTNRVQLM